MLIIWAFVSSHFAADRGSCLDVGENAGSGKCNKAKHNKTRYACNIVLILGSTLIKTFLHSQIS